MSDRTGWNRPALVLLASAHEWALRSLDSILGPSGYEVVRVYKGRDALARARGSKPDAIILDVDFSDLDGLAVCRALRVNALVSDSTPIIMLMGEPITRQRTLEALRAGATSLWGQPLDTEEFLLRLEAHLRAKRDADRARANGLVDEITGMYNRHGLTRRVEELASQASRLREPLACVMLAPEAESPATPAADAAGGAHESDGVMQALARALAATRRLGDTIGRFGPTEFAVLAPHTDAAGARQLGARLAEAAERASAPVLRLRGGYDVVSGIERRPPDPLALLARAASALRTATAGGDRIRRFEGGPPA